MTFRLVFVVLIFITGSCMTHQITYEYADGSANVYLLTETELRYVPVTPAESSTGMYSGGEPKTVAVTPAQFSELQGLFDTALNNTAIHIPDRIKTSGMISQMGAQKAQCIIKPYCAEMIAIEAKLKEFLAR